MTGYVASQNKFELKLPLLDDWNQKFFFYACGGFCGTVLADACNLGLSRGYASVTGNGGHDSVLGFDGIWAANAPELEEDFGWRSNHVVILIAKAITAHYYGKPIKYSYMAGNSKGGQDVLLEAQRFPEDFDGLMPSDEGHKATCLRFAFCWRLDEIGQNGMDAVKNIKQMFLMGEQQFPYARQTVSVQNFR